MPPRPNSVMVIDDDPGFLVSCEEELCRAGYSVLLALTGKQSRQLADVLGSDIGLALVDLVMPTENGLEVIRRLRSIAPEMPIIAITERASAFDMEMARYFGAAVTLLKPVGPAWITAIERAVTDRVDPANRT